MENQDFRYHYLYQYNYLDITTKTEVFMNIAPVFFFQQERRDVIEKN